MKPHATFIYALVLFLVAPSVRAQDSPDLWQSFAERLPAGAFVVVHLRDGQSVEGRLVRVASETVSVLPKTRLPVPAQEIKFSDILSIESRREPMSPGAKVLTGIGIAGGVFLVLTAIATGGFR